METLCRMCHRFCKTDKMTKGRLVYCTGMPDELKTSQADLYQRIEERKEERKKKEGKSE